jgi:hypothetical protein
MKLKWMAVLFVSMACFLSVGGVFAQFGDEFGTTAAETTSVVYSGVQVDGADSHVQQEGAMVND